MLTSLGTCMRSAGETCLCGVDASGKIDYNDDSCNVCSCGTCPPPVNNAVGQPPPSSPPPASSPPPGESPQPAPSPSPSPNPETNNPNITRLTVQTGSTLPYLNGSSLYYNGTVDPRISTQYNASWNNYQGSTQFWPHAGQWDGLVMGISDSVGGYASRVLLKFSDLHLLLPASANLTRARLLLYFDNWANATTPLMVGMLSAVVQPLCHLKELRRPLNFCSMPGSHTIVRCSCCQGHAPGAPVYHGTCTMTVTGSHSGCVSS